MKQIISILIVLWATSYKAQEGQQVKEGEAVYVLSMGGGQKEREKAEKKMEDSMKITKKEATKVVMDMLFSGKTATQVIKFQGYKVLSEVDIKPKPKTRADFNISQFILEKRGDFYTDWSQGVVYNSKVYNDREIIIKYNIQDLKWNITDDTKVINGYQCRKATAKYKFAKEKGKQKMGNLIAWFSEDIPIRVAPEQFYGLPGLVVMLQRDKHIYVLSSINPKKVNISYKVDIKKAISEDEFMELTNEVD